MNETLGINMLYVEQCVWAWDRFKAKRKMLTTGLWNIRE